MKDLAQNVKVDHSLSAVVRTASANGTGIDTQGFQSVTLVADVGAAGITLNGTNKFSFSLEDSDAPASGFAAVTNNTLVTGGTVDGSGIFQVVDAPAHAAQAYKLGYVGGKRYVRGVVTHAGTHSTGTIVGLSVELGDPISGPTANQAND